VRVSNAECSRIGDEKKWTLRSATRETLEEAYNDPERLSARVMCGSSEGSKAGHATRHLLGTGALLVDRSCRALQRRVPRIG